MLFVGKEKGERGGGGRGGGWSYGAEARGKVDEIGGAGNHVVAYAKEYLFGQVGI
ncbi:hypothetical protein D9743_13325, partial [Staphylococcus aureus]